jgi:anthranilate synthase component 1
LYLDFAGNLDSCIALRTMVIKNGVAYIRPAEELWPTRVQREYQESVNKSKALQRALQAAHHRE